MDPPESPLKGPTLNIVKGNSSGAGRQSLFKRNYQKQIMKRDTKKIKTNPKYRCKDEGSEDEADAAKGELQDLPQELSLKEQDFRETILKFEKRRKKKEKKQREREIRRNKQLN